MPVVNYINTYRHEVAAFFANSTAATQASLPNITQTKSLHYLRISNPVNPEVLTNYQKRLESNRANPYMDPGSYTQLASRTLSFRWLSVYEQPTAHDRLEH